LPSAALTPTEPSGTPPALDCDITSEAVFRWTMLDDRMASEKLDEGIRQFHAAYLSLRRHVAARLDRRKSWAA
jgi:transaldolase